MAFLLLLFFHLIDFFVLYQDEIENAVPAATKIQPLKKSESSEEESDSDEDDDDNTVSRF